MITRTSGFSTLELMIVIAIAVGGFFMALGGSGSSGMLVNQAKFADSNVQLLSVLQQARNTARTKQQCVTVQINPQQIIVNGYSMTGPSVNCFGPLTNLDLNSAIVSNFPTNVTLAQFLVAPTSIAANPFIFNQQGATDYGNTAAMTITSNSAAFTKTYTVLPLIGQIQAPP